MFGRDPDRTSGQLEAVLTRLQTISQPSRGVFGIVALSFVLCGLVGRTVRAHGRLLERLPALLLRAPVYRMDPKKYSYMKDLVLCGVALFCFVSAVSRGASFRSMALRRGHRRSSRL